jgi:hypothetical protein
MSTGTPSPFIAAAQQQGFGEAAARGALAAIAGRLAEHRLTARRLFCFRSGGAGGGDNGASPPPPARPRLLLAFQSADDALGFAQRSGLGAAPRLISLSLEQALAALVQRPALGALLLASDGDATVGGLPAGLRIERATLLELLAGVAP